MGNINYTASKKFRIIVAVHETNEEDPQKKYGIGYKNALPWDKIPEDMKSFKMLTTDTTGSGPEYMNAVIMGRKTWLSIPEKFRPLDNRYNIILSRNNTYELEQKYEHTDNVEICDSFEDALKLADAHHSIKTVYVIGGQQIYAEAINHPNLDGIDLTLIKSNDSIKNFDTYFPKIPHHMKQIATYLLKSEVGYDLEFITYQNMRDKLSGEYQYLNLVEDILENGTEVVGRNGPVKSIFGPQQEFDLSQGFPLLTTKKMFFKGILKELLFFVKGHTDNTELVDQGVKIWSANTSREFLDSRNLQHYAEGDMGPMYGFQWRHFGAKYEGCKADYTGKGTDQLRNLLNSLINDKHSRRHLLTTYDPSAVSKSVLAPCHGLTIQFHVQPKINDKTNQVQYTLNCKMYQRSVDVALGYPFNIASYALFVHMICKVTGYLPGKLIMTLGDTHIYAQHYEKIRTQLKRHPLKFPTLDITPEYNGDSVDDALEYLENLTFEDFVVSNYHCYPGIKMKMIA